MLLSVKSFSYLFTSCSFPTKKPIAPLVVFVRGAKLHTTKNSKEENTHRIDQIVQGPQHPRRDMLPWHASDFERGPLPFTSAGRLDVNEHVLEEVQVVDSGEGFFGAFGLGEVRFGVGGGDDG